MNLSKYLRVDASPGPLQCNCFQMTLLMQNVHCSGWVRNLLCHESQFLHPRCLLRPLCIDPPNSALASEIYLFAWALASQA